MTDRIDFSAKHDTYILNPDGTVQPMDQPYFSSEKVADGTWQILSDGDYSYLLAGEDEAIVIDSGYGAGNIRRYAQTLTAKPIHGIINTHDHFDHTANDAYFDYAYMSAETRPLATIPYPSFAGISFPRDYPVRIVDDGDVIPLRGRELLVMKMPDHAVGSILLLDRKERLLFAGDEIAPVKRVNGTVEKICHQLARLETYRSDFDRICAGPGVFGADLVDRLLACAEAVLAGGEGTPLKAEVFRPITVSGYEGKTIYPRRGAHTEDLPPDFGKADPEKRAFTKDGVTIVYDIRRVTEP